MPDKSELRNIVRQQIDTIAAGINAALRGQNRVALEPVLERIGRGGILPPWYQKLKEHGILRDLQPKTIGSIVEMLFVAVLETSILDGLGVPPLRINPARGIDLPDLDLGIKSPSENYCTSEPYFSAYERLLGGECDVLVLLTDYQNMKDDPTASLQIIKWRYLTKTQIADSSLCALARKHREWLIADSEASAQRVFRFLAYVNQSDWRARFLIRIADAMQSNDEVKTLIAEAKRDFEAKNTQAIKKAKPLIPDSDLEAIERIEQISPCHVGVIEALDNWVVEILKDAARTPSANEWARLKSGPLDGMIGMSFALQWRFNFGRLFGVEGCEVDPELPAND